MTDILNQNETIEKKTEKRNQGPDLPTHDQDHQAQKALILEEKKERRVATKQVINIPVSIKNPEMKCLLKMSIEKI